MCVYTDARAHRRAHTYGHLHTETYMHAHRETRTHVYTRTHTDACTETHTHRCTQTHIQTPAHRNTCIHTCTHTHIWTPAHRDTHVHRRMHRDMHAHTCVHKPSVRLRADSQMAPGVSGRQPRWKDGGLKTAAQILGGLPEHHQMSTRGAAPVSVSPQGGDGSPAPAGCWALSTPLCRLLSAGTVSVLPAEGSVCC